MGQWTIAGYYAKAEETAHRRWMAAHRRYRGTIDAAQGTMQIRDRAKDLIKTGGEWISSIDLEKCRDGSPPPSPWPRSSV